MIAYFHENWTLLTRMEDNRFIKLINDGIVENLYHKQLASFYIYLA